MPRPLSRKNRTILSGQILADSKFREDFLKDPKKAAAKLGIKLTKAQCDDALAQAGALRKAAADTRRVLMPPGTRVSPMGGAVTGWILD